MRLVVIGADIVALGFATAAATVNERLKTEGKPVAEQIASTQRQTSPDRTGATIASISAVPGEGGVLWEIGPETFYSRFLEDGTAKMAPRPFVGPSGDLHADDWFRVASDVAADV